MDVHQAVFHVLADFCNQMDAIDEQLLEQCFANIALVSDQFTEHFLMELLVPQRFPAVHVPLGKHEIEYLTFVVDYQVQFEPKEPADRALPLGGNTLENFVLALPFDVARPERGRIDERNAGTVAQAARFEEYGHGDGPFAL